MASQKISDNYYLWILVSFIVLTLFSWPIYNAFLHPLAAVPGPRHWTATPYFYARAINRGRYAQKSLELHRKFGPIVRVAPSELSIIASEAWSIVYAYNSGTSFPKSAYWFQPRPNGAFGILACPNSEHGRFRQVFAQAFTERSLSDHENLIDKHVENLVNKLIRLSKQDVAINITDELDFATFDIAGDFAYSRSFECLQKMDNRNQIHFVHQSMKILTARAMRRIMGIDRLANIIDNALTSMQPKKTPYQLALTTWTRTRLNEAHEKEKPDLMDLVAESTRKSKTLRPNEAENAIGDFMLAGTETVSTTVAATLFNLTSHPETLEQLRGELMEFKRTSPLDHRSLAQMPLLNAIINETMRLAPSIPHALPRTVPAPGTHIAGYFLPKGTGVSFNQFAAYRNPANFSAPATFNPQRWVDPASFPVHNAAIFHPFSFGPRSCIGKQWGLRVVRALIAQIVLNFDVRRLNTDWKWEDQSTSFVWEKRDLELVMKLR